MVVEKDIFRHHLSSSFVLSFCGAARASVDRSIHQRHLLSFCFAFSFSFLFLCAFRRRHFFGMRMRCMRMHMHIFLHLIQVSSPLQMGEQGCFTLILPCLTTFDNGYLPHKHSFLFACRTRTPFTYRFARMLLFAHFGRQAFILRPLSCLPFATEDITAHALHATARAFLPLPHARMRARAAAASRHASSSSLRAAIVVFL